MIPVVKLIYKIHYILYYVCSLHLCADIFHICFVFVSERNPETKKTFTIYEKISIKNNKKNLVMGSDETKHICIHGQWTALNVVRREPSELKRLLLHWAIKLVIFYETFAGSYYFYRECFLPEMQKTENYISIFHIISIYQKCQYRDNYKRCANMAFFYRYQKVNREWL